MNILRRFLSLTLTTMLLLSLLPTSGVRAVGANLSLSSNKAGVLVGDTFTLSILGRDMTVSSLAGNLTFDPSLVTCVSLSSKAALTSQSGETTEALVTSTSQEANASGVVGFSFAGTEDVSYRAGTLLTVTFRAETAGVLSFSLKESSDGADGFSPNVTALVSTFTVNVFENVNLVEQTAPAAPTLLSLKGSTVTLAPVSGYEYSMDGITWQTSNTFSALRRGTTYRFFQRVAERRSGNTVYLPSKASAALAVTTEKLIQSAPTVTDAHPENIAASATVTACDSPLYNDSFQPTTVIDGDRSGNAYQTADFHEGDWIALRLNEVQFIERIVLYWESEEYIDTYDHEGYHVYFLQDGQWLRATGLYVTRQNLSGEDARTTDTIAVNGSIEGVKIEFRDGNVDHKYAPKLYEVEVYSPFSQSDLIQEITSRSVTLVPGDSLEYSLDGVNWQTSNTFMGLSPLTTYHVWFRYAETDTFYTSPAAGPVAVTTLSATGSNTLPGDVTLDGLVTASDLTDLARHIGGIEKFTDPAILQNAEVDGHTDITATDLTKLARIVGGIE